MEMMKKGGREDLVKEEEEKLAVIKNYLPPELSDMELESLVTEVIKNRGYPQLGAAIAAVMQRVKGRASGKRVAELVKRKLNL